MRQTSSLVAVVVVGLSVWVLSSTQSNTDPSPTAVFPSHHPIRTRRRTKIIPGFPNASSPQDNVADNDASREQQHGKNDGDDIMTPPPTRRLNDALFLHVGKAGGGSIKWRLKHEWMVIIPHSHPYPNMPRVKALDTDTPLLINVRDPIDRYVSAIYWRLYIMCDIDGPEPRPSDSAAPDGNAIAHPDQYCQDDRPEEAEILFHQYQRNATLLAESLYDDDEGGEQARADLRKVKHAGSSLSEWLGFDWQASSDRLFPIVLEKPLDMMKQTDAFVEWLYQQNHFENATEFAHRREYVHQVVDCSKDMKNHGTGDVNVAHSSGQSHGGGRDLSPRALRNLARFYADDYRLLQTLLDTGACQTVDCAVGVQSILDRRASLLSSVHEKAEEGKNDGS